MYYRGRMYRKNNFERIEELSVLRKLARTVGYERAPGALGQQKFCYSASHCEKAKRSSFYGKRNTSNGYIEFKMNGCGLFVAASIGH